MLLGLLGMLVGIGLGTRYRAFVLVPATGLAWIAVAGLGFGSALAPMVAAMLMTGATLQFGFLIGIAMRRVVWAARARAATEAPQFPAAR